ncbi:MAG: ATP synthase F1 subunit gamma [Treponema sp.]|jgi:F-type H+-transporting ATPase subunit gamma|nr:ATP synthase F1 subunit gamma [Treponema sp.]
MANLRDVRLRMRAITQTLKVTKAMNLISTSKLRKGRRVLEDTEPFFTRIQKTMCDILAGQKTMESRFLAAQTRPPASAGPAAPDTTAPRRSAVIAVTSDKGLAGGYNAAVFREVVSLCENLSRPEGGGRRMSPVLILIGAIGYRYFIRSPYVILENFSFKSKLPDMEDAREISDYIISQYLWGMFDEVHIVYTHMHSAVKLLPLRRQILPLNAEKLQEEIEKSGRKKRVELQFEYLPSEEEVFDALVPLYVKGIIYGCLVESYAGEQSARMAAMDEASKSAEKMLGALELSHNRARQAGITQEVTEIVSGSAALSG